MLPIFPIIPFIGGAISLVSNAASSLFSGKGKEQRKARQAARQETRAIIRAKKATITAAMQPAAITAGKKFDIKLWLQKNWFVPVGVLGSVIIIYFLPLLLKKKK